MSCEENFYQFVKSVVFDLHGEAMTQTVENSTWHREANVWVHTEMVMAEFAKIAQEFNLTEQEFDIGLICCAYHDVGKPRARRPHESGEGFTFYNHEVMSANYFRDDYMVDSRVASLCHDVSYMEFIRFLIQVHLPYKNTNTRGLSILKSSIIYYAELALIPKDSALNIYYSFLRADARGRISDDHAEKLKNLENWISEFDEIPVFVPTKPSNHNIEVIAMCGAPGSGKTTAIKNAMTVIGEEYEVYYFSFDDVRNMKLEELKNVPNDNSIIPDDLYFSVNSEVNGELSRFASKFKKMKSQKKVVIYVDMTFVTRRRRLFLKSCFPAALVTFNEICIPIATCIKQNSNRTGRSFVSEKAILESFFNTTLPQIDEFTPEVFYG